MKIYRVTSSKPIQDVGQVRNLPYASANASVVGQVTNLPYVLIFFLALFFTGCGKIGDPLPPVPRTPLIVNELDVTQQGSRLIVSIPLVRAPRTSPPQAVVIYRLIENAAAPIGLTEETFAARASVIKELPLDKLAVGSTVLTYQDELDLNAQPKGVRYRYAIRLLNRDGRAADFSNYALIEPLADLAAAPADLKSQLTQTELVISWTPSAANENGTTPANVFGYNLYRKASPAPKRGLLFAPWK